MTLAPPHVIGRSENTAPASLRTSASRVRGAAAGRRQWWQWLDFDSKILAQVWFICCTQIVVLVIGGLVIHASSASPY